MGYSVALRTNDKEQSVEILNFIQTNLPKFTTVFPYFIEDVEWYANDLTYIADYPHIGFQYTGTDLFYRLYVYSIIYQVALKFNLQTIINNEPIVVLDYDSQCFYYLGETNPFAKDDPRFFDFILFENDLIYQRKESFSKNLFKTLYHLKPNKKELKKVLDIVKMIKTSWG